MKGWQAFTRMATLVLAFALTATTAPAWDGAATGRIYQIDVTGGDNCGFRVILEGAPALCSNGLNWAYLNDSDSNYKTYVTALMTANALGQTVTLYNTIAPNGYCHIGYIAINH
jgi:hypothetical protein